jgi:hypothetical protein
MRAKPSRRPERLTPLPAILPRPPRLEPGPDDLVREIQERFGDDGVRGALAVLDRLTKGPASHADLEFIITAEV